MPVARAQATQDIDDETLIHEISPKNTKRVHQCLHLMAVLGDRKVPLNKLVEGRLQV